MDPLAANLAEFARCAPQAEKVHRELIIQWEKDSGFFEKQNQQEISAQADKLARGLYPSLKEIEYARIGQAVADRIVGLGLLEPLLQDLEVTEIMVNGTKSVFVERAGKLEPVPFSFQTPEEILSLINHIVGKIGRRIDEANPYVDARLSDGSRVNAIIPPLALNGPTLTIRRFPATPFILELLLEKETLSKAMAAFLTAAVAAKQNILISGGTGSGKTSTLNALGNAIPRRERIITIEDAAEMRINHPHIVALEARPPNVEGKGEIPIRLLVKNALRMRPDRIIVGETRGGEALDMLQAMNTGHQGSLTTVHANSAEEALSRLETMALMADVDLPLSAVRSQIAAAIHYIVQQERLVDGSRKIVSIHEVDAEKRTDGEPVLTLIYYYNHKTRRFIATEKLPSRLEQFANYNVAVDLAWFNA